MNTETAEKPKGKVDTKTKEMQQRAARAQEQARAARKEAPAGAILSNPIHRIPQKDLIKKYAERDGFAGKQDHPEGFHYMFGDRDMTDQYPDQGYEPVLDLSAGGTQKQVAYKGDPMWRIPTDIHQAELEENARRSTLLARGKAEADVRHANRGPFTSGETVQTAEAGTPAAEQILRDAGV